VSDWLLGTVFFVTVLNPAVLVLLMMRGGEERFGLRAVARQLPGLGASLVVLLVMALLAEDILDLLDLSLSTFQIAAGTLIVFGALQAFLAVGVEPEVVSPGWASVRMLVWMVSPAPLALAISLGASDGFGIAAGAIVAGVAVTLLLAVFWLLWRRDGERAILGWLRRLIAAAAVIAAIDLIRQGVENV
jgi:hypothetical protein